jgi:hypothetical protein
MSSCMFVRNFSFCRSAWRPTPSSLPFSCFYFVILLVLSFYLSISTCCIPSLCMYIPLCEQRWSIFYTFLFWDLFSRLTSNTIQAVSFQGFCFVITWVSRTIEWAMEFWNYVLFCQHVSLLVLGFFLTLSIVMISCLGHGFISLEQ